MAASFFYFNSFAENLPEKVHNLGADTHKIFLSNQAPSATNAIKSEITEISAGFGYTAGGNSAAVSTSAQTSGTYKLVLTSPTTWTASGGSIGPLRYAYWYNDTPTSPLDPLIGCWDYGSSFSISSGETFAVTLDSSGGVLTITHA